MTAFVGTQKDFTKVLQALVQFEYAIVEAYDAAISRLRRGLYKEKLMDFRENHERHIRLVGDLLEEHGEAVPEGTSIAQEWLRKGKTILESLKGDKDILRAVKNSEDTTMKIYEHINHHAEKWEDAEPIIVWSLEDEYYQQQWLKSVLKEK